MTHVKHLGWDLELKVHRIVDALLYVPENKRGDIVHQLKPIGLQRAVADMLGLDR